MKKNKVFYVLILFSFSLSYTRAQISARMFRYPDVSKSHIAFSYAGDIWIVPKEGGVAQRLSSPSGEEVFPKFSPEGSEIAFTGNYNGNSDIYLMPALGGVPKRITFHGGNDRLLGWNPSGDQLLFASTRESGRQRFNQFYVISKDGGLAEKLPMPYAELGSFSPDGKSIAYTDKTRVFRTWKRYEGGMAADIFLFNLADFSSQKITSNSSNQEFPMWHGDKVYYLSDQGEEKRFNLWVQDINSGEEKQLTRFTEDDVHFPSLGPEEIVFEAADELYLLNLSTEAYKTVEVKVVTDQLALVPKQDKVKDYLQNLSISPDGNRAIAEARGELFSLPAENGYVKNLTSTSGIAERFPAWSPDGKYVAYWSDRSGEYELTLLDLATNKERKLTSYGPGFRYHLFWSPDSKKIVFIDQESHIRLFDLSKNRTVEVDQDNWLSEGGLSAKDFSWSADSRWLAYSKSMDNTNQAIFVFDTQNANKHQLTSGYYSDSSPAFDPDGKYLYILTNRHFSPVYGDFGNTFVYPNATQVAAIALRNDVPFILAPKNDEATVESEKEEESFKKGKKNKKEKEEVEADKPKSVTIDFSNIEERMVVLPPSPGNYSDLNAVSGKVVYHQRPRSGGEDKTSPIKYFDLEEREETTIVQDALGFQISANGEKVLVVENDLSGAIVELAADQKLEKKLPLGEMDMTVEPKAEWKQIFMDAWRFERDYFYDKNMHGVDWEAMKEKYGKMMDVAVTRWDVNFVIGELIGELNASHAYRGGGDTEKAKQETVGYLGIDWEIANGHYRIKRVVRGAPWDAEVYSPLALPGLEIKAGDYILEVNGRPVNIDQEPYAAFQGLAGKTVELLVNSSPSLTNARKVIVEPMDSEERLRHLEWIETHRKMVSDETDNRVGYIYVRSTGIDGQNELIRQFAAQMDKDGLIIDERFNSGGQIPDRFIELLNRQPLAYWAVRNGKDWNWPPHANFGPKVMLINGWSGSGGDAFPDYFRKTGLGPLVGTRTWGGLIGISGAPQLIDGGMVTVPTFRMFNPDGTWFKEGHGVDPDIEVPENPTELAKGNDPQLEKAIEWIKKELKENPYKKPEHPTYEVR
ncbi:S41 family peptidase, partial [Xanthovirga aplysinae]|uniref:S41 family peptidase n=1 Tax=Xanthovirga aplysinae TaxID=2529853 RepID=UPI0012BB9FC9